MCGRYVIACDLGQLADVFGLARVAAFERRWNAAPQSQVPVVYETREGERVCELMRWGLVPHWAKDVSLGHKLNNARAEGVFEKPSFRQAIRRRRCLLPATGFYEWHASAAGKQPWYVSPRQAPLFAMAGLFEAWRPAGQDAPEQWLLTCCVITTSANTLMAPIHDRMPVMVAPPDWARWLSRSISRPEDLSGLLVPPDADSMQAWPVSRAVNRAGHEGPGLIEPLVQPPTQPRA